MKSKAAAAPRGRFRDPGTQIAVFGERVLVECPECGGCAEIRTRQHGPSFAAKLRRGDQSERLVCDHCGHFVQWAETLPWKPVRVRGVTSFGLPLWLQTTCHGRLLWVYNPAHLGVLRAFIEATDRRRGDSKSSAIGILPQWIISAKNRPDVLRGLARLERKAQRIER